MRELLAQLWFVNRSGEPGDDSSCSVPFLPGQFLLSSEAICPPKQPLYIPEASMFVALHCAAFGCLQDRDRLLDAPQRDEGLPLQLQELGDRLITRERSLAWNGLRQFLSDLQGSIGLALAQGQLTPDQARCSLCQITRVLLAREDSSKQHFSLF